MVKLVQVLFCGTGIPWLNFINILRACFSVQKFVQSQNVTIKKAFVKKGTQKTLTKLTPWLLRFLPCYRFMDWNYLNFRSRISNYSPEELQLNKNSRQFSIFKTELDKNSNASSVSRFRDPKPESFLVWNIIFYVQNVIKAVSSACHQDFEMNPPTRNRLAEKMIQHFL